jgi:chromosome segregation ATPase
MFCFAAFPAVAQNAHVPKKDPDLVARLQERLDRIREHALAKKELEAARLRASEAETEVASLKEQADVMAAEIAKILEVVKSLEREREAGEKEIAVLRKELGEKDALIAEASERIGKQQKEIAKILESNAPLPGSAPENAPAERNASAPPPDAGTRIVFFSLVDPRYAAYRDLCPDGQEIVFDIIRFCNTGKW